MAKMNTAEVTGTANEIIEFLQATGNGLRYRLIPESSFSLSESGSDEVLLSSEEEEKLFDELSLIGLGRLDPSLKYDREDIYFDR